MGFTMTANMYKAVQKSLEFYHSKWQEPKAVEYLMEKRGLTQETIEFFKLGYAPDGWNSLKEIFPDYRTNQDYVTASLLVDNGEHKYDFFRDRVMFPILDEQNRAIGFGGRSFNDEDPPKYKNTGETPIFHKGEELYGYNHAKEHIQKQGYAFVVEGYMDVVVPHQYGIKNAVAALGTACTVSHLTKLFEAANTIIFCFDGDKAGRQAAWRATERVLPLLTDEKRAFVVFLPEDEDPDTFVKKHGKDEFLLYVKSNSIPVGKYVVEFCKNKWDGLEGQAKFLVDLKKYYSMVSCEAIKQKIKKEVQEYIHETRMDVVSALLD